jgi:hypothetical protein
VAVDRRRGRSDQTLGDRAAPSTGLSLHARSGVGTTRNPCSTTGPWPARRTTPQQSPRSTEWSRGSWCRAQDAIRGDDAQGAKQARSSRGPHAAVEPAEGPNDPGEPGEGSAHALAQRAKRLGGDAARAELFADLVRLARRVVAQSERRRRPQGVARTSTGDATRTQHKDQKGQTLKPAV